MEDLQNVAFMVVATTKNSLFSLDGNPILTAQPNSIATKLDTHAPDACLLQHILTLFSEKLVMRQTA